AESRLAPAGRHPSRGKRPGHPARVRGGARQPDAAAEQVAMITLLLVGAIALILLTAVLAPLEALGWWAGWSGQGPSDAEYAGAEPEPAAPTSAGIGHYLVFLSGIGAISGVSVPQEEIDFLDLLEPRLLGTRLIRDVFPYSVTNNGLNGQRAFAS